MIFVYARSISQITSLIIVITNYNPTFTFAVYPTTTSGWQSVCLSVYSKQQQHQQLNSPHFNPISLQSFGDDFIFYPWNTFSIETQQPHLKRNKSMLRSMRFQCWLGKGKTQLWCEFVAIRLIRSQSKHDGFCCDCMSVVPPLARWRSLAPVYGSNSRYNPFIHSFVRYSAFAIHK